MADFSRPMTAQQAVRIMNRLHTELKKRQRFEYNPTLLKKKPFSEAIQSLYNILNNKLTDVKSPIPGDAPYYDDSTLSSDLNEITKKIILDKHGAAIINSILKVNTISEKFVEAADNASNIVSKYVGTDATVELINNEPGGIDDPIRDYHQSEYMSEAIQSLINEYKSVISKPKDNKDTDEIMNHVYSRLIDFCTSVGEYHSSHEISDNVVTDVIVKPLPSTYSSGKNHNQDDFIRDVISITFDYDVLNYLCDVIEAENNLFDKLFSITGKNQDHKSEDIHYMANRAPFDQSSCRQCCVGLCAGSCYGTCNGCGACTSFCSGTCDTNCSGTCLNVCRSSCEESCKDECNGCDGECKGGCILECTSICGTECTGKCGDSKCASGCYGTTKDVSMACGCGSTCSSVCGSTCTGQSTTAQIKNPNAPVITINI